MTFIIRFFFFMFMAGTFGILHASNALIKPSSLMPSSAHRFPTSFMAALSLTDNKKRGDRDSSIKSATTLDASDDNSDDDGAVVIHLPSEDYKTRAAFLLAQKATQDQKDPQASLVTYSGTSIKTQSPLSLGQQIRSALPSVPSLNLTTRFRGLHALVDRILSINQPERFLVGTPLENRLPNEVWAIIDDYAQLWGELYQLKDTGNHTLKSAAFNHDGTRIVTVSTNGYRLWNTKTKKQIGSLMPVPEGDNENINPVFSSDNNYITAAPCDMRRCIRLWNAKTGKRIKTFSRSTLVKFSPNNTRIITLNPNAFDTIANLYDTKERKKIATLSGHREKINSAEFSVDGSRIVTASADHTARLWNAHDGSWIATMRGHDGSILSAEFSHDGKHIITAARDCTARLWDTANGAWIATLIGHTKTVNSAQFSPDNTRILTTSWDSTGHLWNADNGTPIATLKGHNSDIIAHFNRDGTRILTKNYYKQQFVQLWDAKEGSLIKKLQMYKGSIASAHFSFDGTQIITATDNGVNLWNSDDGLLITTLMQGISCNSARFNQNGTQIVTIDGHTVRVWQKIKL